MMYVLCLQIVNKHVFGFSHIEKAQLNTTQYNLNALKQSIYPFFYFTNIPIYDKRSIISLKTSLSLQLRNKSISFKPIGV